MYFYADDFYNTIKQTHQQNQKYIKNNLPSHKIPSPKPQSPKASTPTTLIPYYNKINKTNAKLNRNINRLFSPSKLITFTPSTRLCNLR